MIHSKSLFYIVQILNDVLLRICQYFFRLEKYKTRDEDWEKPSSCGGFCTLRWRTAKVAIIASTISGEYCGAEYSGARSGRGRTNTTCIFHIFGSLILRCYIYICICSNGGYDTSISRCIAPKVLMYSVPIKVINIIFVFILEQK